MPQMLKHNGQVYDIKAEQVDLIPYTEQPYIVKRGDRLYLRQGSTETFLHIHSTNQLSKAWLVIGVFAGVCMFSFLLGSALASKEEPEKEIIYIQPPTPPSPVVEGSNKSCEAFCFGSQ